MTKDIPASDQLFVGLEKIVYENYESGDHFTATKTEVEAALATAPNGSLFGSSYYRIPFSWGVAVWNKYADKDTGFARWMTKTFGKQPVLMSWVNPELRASVAQSVLRNNGYFGGRVSYQNVPRKNPKTAKIRYTVNPGRLYTIDTVGYYGFPAEADSIIRATLPTAYIRQGDAFSTASLDAERNRVSGLLRNQGYYYYQPAYASFLADTFQVDGKAQLRFQLADDVPAAAKHKWYIGRIAINMKKQMMEQPTDSLRGRFFTIRYSGKKPPIRPRVLMADLKLRPRQPYSYANYVSTASKLNAMGLFSMTDFSFTPRDTTALCDTLDLTLNCVFDKPWDFYIETVFNARTIGRLGPELRLGVTRRNAFRGGEKIDISLHGSYEWTTSGSSSMSSYEYGADASVEFPRLIAPFYGGNRIYRTKDGRPRRRIFYGTPTTLAKFSVNILHRPKYYRMTVFSGEWTYRWQKTVRSRHELSPLTVKYQYMNHHTDDFEQVMLANPYLRSTMQDYFIPEMRYTYTFTSAPGRLHPIRWETTVAQSGNLTSLAMMAFGKKWSERDKKLFSNPYSQFLKLETDFSKTWTLGSHSHLVGHVNAGIVWAFGNSRWLPNSESFYVGGANSIRAFSVREIGPGSFAGLADKATSYLVQNGDLKFVCNLEYRRRLFGSLHAAVFLDAGNVWNLREPDVTETTDVSGVTVYGGKFQLKNMLREMAVGTGIGLRYDLDFLILRLDWGIALHAPYDTGRSGFYNIPKFSKGHALHFAIGYPF
jgi:outer membrane translocation and assembly module TamA